MKDAFQVAWIQKSLERLNLRSRLPLARKTPWYRKTYRNVPVMAVGLMLPLALFVLWKLAHLGSNDDSRSADAYPEQYA